MTGKQEFFIDQKDSQRIQTIEGLNEEILKAKESNASVASWQCKFIIGKDLPSDNFVNECSNQFARFAKICQNNEILSVIEIQIEREGFFDSEVNNKI